MDIPVGDASKDLRGRLDEKGYFTWLNANVGDSHMFRVRSEHNDDQAHVLVERDGFTILDHRGVVTGPKIQFTTDVIKALSHYFTGE